MRLRRSARQSKYRLTLKAAGISGRLRSSFREQKTEEDLVLLQTLPSTASLPLNKGSVPVPEPEQCRTFTVIRRINLVMTAFGQNTGMTILLIALS
ncbi:uncharacterized protein LY89DRAFT_685611 [Mollisia scopiformis]|uniref:Uncharacterized protein n=1 Tax=Mollisia scopiformis TaxID=149040 RepID=A0A194X6G1_MOLSC|nr:uncharacterized protein LY89DRAFT_685611 [Mollisia scopiformis]KUJ15659.1 hypothetical protein LY89DRAFT_685611 [Mollisia scopiformis]